MSRQAFARHFRCGEAFDFAVCSCLSERDGREISRRYTHSDGLFRAVVRRLDVELEFAALVKDI